MTKRNNSIWSEKAILLAKELHNEISLDNYNWHLYRGNKQRRSAELIISALSQLINDGDDIEIETLLKQAILWIKEDIKDKGRKMVRFQFYSLPCTEVSTFINLLLIKKSC